MSAEPPHPLHPPHHGEANRLHSILRHPTGLEAVLNRPRFSVAQIERARRDKQEAAIDWTNFYDTATLSLARISTALYPRRDTLLASWDALRQVPTLDAVTLGHVLVVLLETVPATLPEDARVIPLPLTSPPDVPKATAAHPRAYQGTTYKPPKPRRLPPLDLQPALCHSRERQRLLRHLRPHLTAALAKLAALGYPPARLASARQIMARSARPLDTGLPDHVPHSSMSPPPLLFLHSLFPSLSALPASDIREYLAVFHSLSLADDPALRAALSRFVSLQNSPVTRAWCRIVARFPAPRRSAFVAQLLESDTYRYDPQHVPLEAVDEFNHLTPDAHYDRWVPLFLEAIGKEVSLEYVLSGFRLAATFNLDASFAIQGDCRDFSYETVEAMILSPPDDYPDAGWYALRLWERCGQLLGFVEVLRQTHWHRFPPTIRRQYADFLVNFIQHDVSGVALEKKWRAVKARLPQLEELLHATPAAYQHRCLGELVGYLWQWDTPEELQRFLPGAYTLSRRLAAPPFRAEVELSHVFGSFLDSPDKQLRDDFLAAPESSFRILEQCCRRENDARLIARGVYSLTRDLLDMTVRAFVRFPRQLGKTAKVLGGLSYEHRATLLRRIADHPLFTTDFTHLAPKDATLAIQRACAGRYWNPIPRHLAAWARGSYTLTPTRVARYHRLVVERLDRTRLDFIEQHVIEALSRTLPVPTVARKNVRHALQLLGGMDDNRRGLRRFLRAHWTGDQDYLLRHPRTQHWLRHHPRVNVDLWTSGIAFQPHAATALGVTLGIEQDPLEVLRLGTYVGSCLGLGGLCDYSAAAVLLDVNKQVLYARDRHGSVVARQLIALSKADEVVCFNIYPDSSPAPIKALFRAYDVALAEALGLARYIPKSHYDTEYDIENILSEEWWDDALWNFEADTGPVRDGAAHGL